MRTLVTFAALALIGAPAMAQQAQSPPSSPPQAERDTDFEMPAELFDPAMGERLGRMMGAVTGVMMDMPIGEIQAAIEGREPTGADRRRTVRDIAGRDPNFERNIQQQFVTVMPRMQAGLKVMARSMPALIAAMEKAADEMEREIDRSTANIPQPGYPRR
jgi:hypothetical protein